MESNRAAPWNSMPNLWRTRINSRSLRLQMFSPSMETCPESGWSRPMTCLSRTLFPPPLRPMMTTDSPLSTRRLTSSRMTFGPKLLRRWLTSIIKVQEPVQRQGEEEIGNEDGDGGIDDGFGCGPAHALRALAAIHAFVAANNGDDAAKDERLDEAHHHKI